MTKDLKPGLWWLYIVECKDGKLYTGVTNDLQRRIRQHNRGQGCRFTKFRTPVHLVHKEKYAAKQLALRREVEIKGWNRDKKLRLINQAGHFGGISSVQTKNKKTFQLVTSALMKK